MIQEFKKDIKFSSNNKSIPQQNEQDVLMDQHNRKLMILCDHFYPAWKLGGTIQSLKNLVFTLSDKIEMAVVTSAYDLDRKEPLPGIKLTEWNDVKTAKIRYLQTPEINYANIKRIMLANNAGTVYINGLFSLPFSIYPLIIRKHKSFRNTKFILSPRGMLQEGALKSKSLKKKLFLAACKFFKLYKNIIWHATDAQETMDIKKHFGENCSVVYVKDTPKSPLDAPVFITKKPGELKLIYLSLIAEKKNLHLAIKWIKELNLPVIFDIYGPIKDAAYWKQCNQLIVELPAGIHIEYKGEVMPNKVQHLFAEYHAMLFPTKGENFGHAIYECLSAGRPVIASTETPWKELEKKCGGYDISLNNEDQFKKAIQTFFQMDQTEFEILINGAHGIATDYWRSNDVSSAYLQLFA